MNKFERKTFKQLICGSTASNACSMQGYKFESETFKQLICGNTASNACSMQGYKNVKKKNYHIIDDQMRSSVNRSMGIYSH